MTAMGDIIGLDYAAVLAVIPLYADNTKEAFESVLICYQIEREVSK